MILMNILKKAILLRNVLRPRSGCTILNRKAKAIRITARLKAKVTKPKLMVE